jgi:hypothetical protein
VGLGHSGCGGPPLLLAGHQGPAQAAVRPSTPPCPAGRPPPPPPPPRPLADSASAPSFGPLAASEQQQQRQQGAGRGRYRRAAPSTLLTSPSPHETPGRGRSAATPAAATPSPAVARAAAAPLSAGSNDPSNLRWGSTGLRSSIILPADSLQQGHSSLSAGRTPLAGRLGRVHTRGRAASAEAESPAACHGGLGEGGQGGGCPRGDKRCRVSLRWWCGVVWGLCVGGRGGEGKGRAG